MKYIPILFILFACSEESDPQPSYQNSCIYRIIQSTNAQDLGEGGEFVRCDEDPNYTVSDPVNYIVEPCNCN